MTDTTYHLDPIFGSLVDYGISVSSASSRTGMKVSPQTSPHLAHARNQSARWATPLEPHGDRRAVPQETWCR